MYYLLQGANGIREEGILPDDLHSDSIRIAVENKLLDRGMRGSFYVSLYRDGTEDSPFTIITVNIA